MVRRGNLAVFESCNISESEETSPTKIGVHALDINPYLHEFLGRFRSINFFDDHGLFANFISETKEATPTKNGVHACVINSYLPELFGLNSIV